MPNLGLISGTLVPKFFLFGSQQAKFDAKMCQMVPEFEFILTYILIFTLHSPNKMFILSLLKLMVIQGIPVFRDFTIRDPRYFVILF